VLASAGEVKTLAFANFSMALVAAAPKKAYVAAGALSPAQASSHGSALSGYQSVTVDYAKQVNALLCVWRYACVEKSGSV
jgi:hypothetical protein